MYEYWYVKHPPIAQLVERSTVEDSVGIEWSLVRFRVSGIFRFRVVRDAGGEVGQKMENLGIDPSASRMLSERSTI